MVRRSVEVIPAGEKIDPSNTGVRHVMVREACPAKAGGAPAMFLFAPAKGVDADRSLCSGLARVSA
jgi:hypothetical protein